MSEINLGGRPEHEPTKETREMASKMSSYGVVQDTIALCIGISLPTLHKYYREELDTSKAHCIVEVADRLMDKIRQGDVPSTMFYLKTQGGWREKDKQDDDKNQSAIEKALNKIPDAVK